MEHNITENELEASDRNIFFLKILQLINVKPANTERILFHANLRVMTCIKDVNCCYK